MTVDELQVLITANTTELRKEIGKANKNISSLQKSASKGTKGVSSAFSKLKTGIIALGIGKVIKDSIQVGMDAIESDSLFETTLGESADAVRSWSDEVSNTLGLNAVAMRKNTGIIYNMTSSMGVAEGNALKMAKGVSVLSEDMASFYNLDSAEAFNKLRAGLTGETEPLKALGILVDENTIKQVAYSEGIAQMGAELTNEQKVLARYVAILKQTGNAQGDLARTINSPANQLRILKNQVTQLGTAFSNFFMPILSAVLPYLTALAQVTTKALTSFAKFIGIIGGGSGGASKKTEEIKNNVGGISGGMDDATKKAKKLKNTLAGFDEMNVLTDNTAESEGAPSGGTATVGLDFDLGEYDANLDGVMSKTDAIVEKIEGVFSSIGEGIDFSNLTTAFSDLKKAVEPITSKIWDGLSWGYDNILKPLAQWTIGNLVPAFLKAISGALKVLNPILESFMTLGGWLWDSFLKPIAQWTGGVIIDVLTGAGDALATIGEWASANQGVIDAMVISFATFFGLWKLTELMAFIQMSGGLVGAFTAITTAIKGCTVAKITDKLETVALTAMYAKDFVVSLAKGTAEMVKQIGQWALLTGAKVLDAVKTSVLTVAHGAWNAICAVGTAVTTALGTAFTFLTSPIGLVVVAITAVIAIVALLIKNWDKVKEVASNVWDGIKNVWSGVANWIKTNVIDPIANFFSGLWNGIKNTFTKIGKVVGDAISGAVKAAVNGILSVACGIINGFISAINLAIKVINYIPGVEIKKLDKLKVPKLAKGGITNGSTLANIGESGREAVLPLENNLGYLDKFAEKIASKIGGVGGNIQLVVKLGEDTIFDRFIDYQKAKSFETNGEVFAV